MAKQGAGFIRAPDVIQDLNRSRKTSSSPGRFSGAQFSVYRSNPPYKPVAFITDFSYTSKRKKYEQRNGEEIVTFNNPSHAVQGDLFSGFKSPTTTQSMLDPASYSGLAGFHKYWGKKPIESIAYLIENLTKEGDVVVDPFLGSGLVAI